MLLVASVLAVVLVAAAPTQAVICADVVSDSLNYSQLKFAVHSKASAARSGACGRAYVSAFNETGWSRLYVTGLRLSTSDFPQSSSFERDLAQSQAAGVVEGFLLSPMLWDFRQNWFASMFGASLVVPAQITSWVDENDKFMRDQIALHANKPGADGNYWRRVALALAQMEGLAVGYALSGPPASQPITTRDFLLLNLNGDMSDLTAALVPSPANIYRSPDSHCSALFKVNADFSDLFWAHTTWAGFVTMTRSLKEYSFDLESVVDANGKVEPKTVVLSGYPSVLYSNDDFYQNLETQLIVIETTNPVIDFSIYKKLTTSSITTWIRAIVANSLATSAPNWTEIFAKHNSGTYNNQWMVLDLKLFTPKKPLRANTLWILEQEPGACQSADVTSYLARGYWPSYNRPFFPKMFDDMGYKTATEQYGNIMSYELAPRAAIFRERNHLATSLEGMKRLMRYNDWQHDPLSLGQAGQSIAGRFDLQTVNPPPAGWFTPGPHGGIDSKVGSYSMFFDPKGMGFIAQSGPTHDQQVPFAWSTTNQTWANSLLHLGMPDMWNFDWVPFQSDSVAKPRSP